MREWQSVVCGAAALVLGSAALRKTFDHRGFRSVLLKHPTLRTAAPVLVRTVPLLEAMLAVLLLALRSVMVPAIAASALSAGFIAVTHTAPPGDCGCGPFVPERRSRRDLMNLAFLVGLPLAVVVD